MEKTYPQIDVHITRGTSGELYRKLFDGDDLAQQSSLIRAVTATARFDPRAREGRDVPSQS
jgi:hypothetical protein